MTVISCSRMALRQRQDHRRAVLVLKSGSRGLSDRGGDNPETTPAKGQRIAERWRVAAQVRRAGADRIDTVFEKPRGMQAPILKALLSDGCLTHTLAGMA